MQCSPSATLYQYAASSVQITTWRVASTRTMRHPGGMAAHLTAFSMRVKFPGNHEWEGMQSARMGDRVGLLLDLDQGSMTVYKNGERLGVMVSGLSGEYCWAVVLGEPGEWLRIAPAILPTTY